MCTAYNEANSKRRKKQQLAFVLERRLANEILTAAVLEEGRLLRLDNWKNYMNWNLNSFRICYTLQILKYYEVLFFIYLFFVLIF